MSKNYGYKGGFFLDNGKLNLAIRRSNLKQNNEIHGFIQGWDRRDDDANDRGAENCTVYFPFRNITGRYISFLSVYEQIQPYDSPDAVIALSHRPKIHDVWEIQDSVGPVSISYSESYLADQESLVDFNKSDGSGIWKKRYVFVETKLDLALSGLPEFTRYLKVEFHPFWNDGTGSTGPAGNEDIYSLNTEWPNNYWHFAGCIISTYKNAPPGTTLYAYDEIPYQTLNALLENIRTDDHPPYLELITGLFSTDFKERQVGKNILFDEKQLIYQDYGFSSLNVGGHLRPSGQGADKGLVFSWLNPAEDERRYVAIERTGEIDPTADNLFIHLGADMVSIASNVYKPRLKQGYVGQQGETGWYDPTPHPDFIAFLNVEYFYFIAERISKFALVDRAQGDALNPEVLRIIFEILAESMYAYRPAGRMVGEGGISSQTSLIPESGLSRNPESAFFVKYDQGALRLSFAPVDYLNG